MKLTAQHMHDQSTASKVWALAAATRGVELLGGGQGSVIGPSFELTLLDGRQFWGVGLREEGEFLVIVLLASPYGSVELWTTKDNLAGEPLPLEPSDAIVGEQE
jgi:hypothetical protein